MDSNTYYLNKYLDEYDSETTRQEKLPHCDYCEEAILDEYLYEIDGVIYCEECIRSFRVLTDEID